MVERALEPRDDGSEVGVIVTQQGHHLFRFSVLIKGRKPPNVAEHDDDFAAMAFKDALIAT